MPRSLTRAHKTPHMEETYIPPESEATTTSAVVPQYFPPFDREDPELWFIQVEAALRTSKITSDLSRFDYIIQRLPPDVSCLRGTLETPPTSNRYEKLRNKLLELYGNWRRRESANSSEPVGWAMRNRRTSYSA